MQYVLATCLGNVSWKYVFGNLLSSGDAARADFEGREGIRRSPANQQRQGEQHGGELLPGPATDLFRLLRPERVRATVDVFGRRRRQSIARPQFNGER